MLLIKKHNQIYKILYKNKQVNYEKEKKKKLKHNTTQQNKTPNKLTLTKQYNKI